MVGKTANNAINVAVAADVLTGGSRLNPQEIWRAYSTGKQTSAQLAQTYGCSRQTILRHLKKAAPKAQFATPKRTNIVMDTTYFGRTFGVMVLFDSISGQALSVTGVKHETNILYAEATGRLKAEGIEIQSIVCDGRRTLPQMFPDIPVQLCQFHQVKTVGRYLTRHPKTEAGRALWRLVLTLKNSTKADFESGLQIWFEEYKAI